MLEEYTFIFCGTSLSLLGYLVLVATAVKFPSWREEPLHRVWLHYATVSLVRTISISFNIYFVFEISEIELIELVLSNIHHLLEKVEYNLSAVWMWLGHGKLVRVYWQPGQYYVLISGAVAWIVAILLSIVRELLHHFSNTGDGMYSLTQSSKILHFVHVAAVTLFNVGISSHVVWSITRHAAFRTRDNFCSLLLHLALCFIIFTASGILAFSITVIRIFRIELYARYLWQLYGLLFSFKVFFCSVVLIVFCRGTRELWILYFRRIRYVAMNFHASITNI